MDNTRRTFFRVAGASLGAGLLGPQLAAGAPAQQAVLPRNGVIDWHAHWIGPSVVSRLRQRTAAPRYVAGSKGELFSVEPGGAVSKNPQSAAWYDVDLRLRHLDEVGVERQVVSWVGAAYENVLSPEEARPFWRAQNDDLAALVKKHPTRFLGLATLPTSNVTWAAQELERAHGELGLLGATLPLDAFVTLAGARALAPIFAVAQKHKSHIYVHRGPAHASIPGQLAEFGPANPYLGLPASATGNDQSDALPGDPAFARARLVVFTRLAVGVITLALSDFLDDYPDVTVQLPMIGGVTPIIAEQIDLLGARDGRPSTRPQFRRVYLDTGATGRGPLSIALAAQAFGADRILFGSDYGPVASVRPYVEGVTRAALTDVQRQQIFVENGRALLAKR